MPAEWSQLLAAWSREMPLLSMLLYLGSILVAAALGNFLVKRLLLRGVERVLGILSAGWAKNSAQLKAIRRLSNVVPALIIMFGLDMMPEVPKELSVVSDTLCTAFIAVTLALAFSAALDALNDFYNRRPDAKAKPIKGYLQLAKIVLFIVTGVMIVSILVGKSPLILLSGVGAMAAVLILVFQDTLLSFVASVQLSSNDSVRVGDWIEMPNLNADGDVIDIALHTVRVQNWDKTITTLPTRRLVTDPFKNWRGMHESGGRRIKRPIYLDQNSIAFLKEEELVKLRRFYLLAEYLEEKEKEIREWNESLGARAESIVNLRRITNIGTFRAYVVRYLKNHPGVNQKMTMITRQLAPTAEGLPLEIYCFTNNTAWVVYEGIQSDIFDHLLSILPEFGLRVFQNPSGFDFKALARGETLENGT
ncbi:MAG TPA: mechanosensitive ion channel family protein [Chthoniobacteraceae bacterium]|nr:mechanosensitive ion channel family protein [Chthoniobacteraceae bacterium]